MMLLKRLNMINYIVAKVNGIDTTNFVLNTKYEKDGSAFEDKINKIDKKIPDVSDLIKKSYFNSKITKVEGKIPSISRLATSSASTAVENKIPDVSGLATSSTLTMVENKIPDVSSLVKKADFNSKITEVEGKIPSINGLATNSALTVVENKIPDATSLGTKTDFDAKLKAISNRVTKNKSKHLLVENELKNVKTFDLSYLRGKNYFEESGTLIYLIFQPIEKYFKRIVGVGNSKYISFWKSRGFPDEKINSITVSNHMITPSLDYLGAKVRVKFSGRCLKQGKITYNHKKIVSIKK